MGVKCDKCRYGTGNRESRCCFADKTGHCKLYIYRHEIGGDLRKAYGPGCVAYQPKSAPTKKKKPSATMVVRERKKSPSTRQAAVAARHDQMREMYNEGMSDRKIAQEMGVDKKTVANWRNRACLPPNARAGGKKKCGYTGM